MTSREMHIEVNQSLQKVAANLTRKFLNDEIDWVLNKMQQRFIQLCLKPKLNAQGKPTGAFTVDELRQDALRNITVTGAQIVTDVTNPRKCKGILPSNYMFLLADQSIISTDCGNWSESSPVVPVTVLWFPPHPGTGPYFTSLVVGANGVTVSLPTDLQYYLMTASLKKEDISFLIPYVLWSLRRQGVEAYWERYDNLYYSNSILIPNASGVTLSYSGTPVTGNQSIVNMNTTILNTSARIGDLAHANRLEESTKIYDLLQTAFYQPSIQSPISELENNVLYIHTSKNFIVPKIVVSYIRKPKPISIILGSDCEIAEEFHQTICDLTVEYLQGRMNHPEGTQLATQDIENRVIL